MRSLLFIFSFFLITSCKTEPDLLVVSPSDEINIKKSVSDYITENFTNLRNFMDTTSSINYENVIVKYTPIEFFRFVKSDSTFESTAKYKYINNEVQICNNEVDRVTNLIKQGESKTYTYFDSTYRMDCVEYRNILNSKIQSNTIWVTYVKSLYTTITFSVYHKYKKEISFSFDGKLYEYTQLINEKYILNSDFKYIWIEYY